MASSDSVVILLAARASFYRIMQNILGNEPMAEMLEELCSPTTRQIFEIFGDESNEYSHRYKSLLSKAEELKNGGDKAIYDLNSAFTRLFVGPGTTEASPWESFYLDKDRSLRQSITLDVRRAYVAQELIPQAYPNVSDDHVAIELDFLARLAERAEAAFTANNQDDAAGALKASADFLEQHLLRWIDGFAKAVNVAKHGNFYREAAAVLKLFAEMDMATIKELQDAIEG